MTRLVVVEARRLLPLAVLFLMLLVVSLYDGLLGKTAPVTTLPNAVPYRTLAQGSQPRHMQALTVNSREMWVAIHQVLGSQLPDHEFNPETQVAVVLLNCQLRATAAGEGPVVELFVIARANTYQVLLFDKAYLPGGGKNVNFVLSEKQE